MTRRVTAAYVIAVDVAAAAVLLTLPASGLAKHAMTLALLVVLASVFGCRPIRMPKLRLQFVAIDVFTLCAMVMLVPIAAPVVALAGAAGTAFVARRRPFSIRAAFNLGAMPLAASAAVMVHASMAGGRAEGSFACTALLAATAAFWGVNAGLAFVATMLESRWRRMRPWIGIASWSAVSYLTSLFVAVGLVVLTRELGVLALALGVVPTLPLLRYFEAAKPRVAAVAEPEASKMTPRAPVAAMR